MRVRFFFGKLGILGKFGILMKYTILNNEFRDQTAECRYPFQDLALLVNDQGIKISDEIFLDMLVTSLLDRELPFYLAELDGTFGNETQMKIVIKDKNNRDVCSSLVDPGTDIDPIDSAYFYDEQDRLSGVAVFHPANMLSLIRRVKGQRYSFSSKQAPILVERCFVTRVAGLSVVQTDAGSVSGDICVVAANGVHFTLSGDKIYVHLLGEEPLTKQPVKSVNDIERSHIWLASWPGDDPSLPSPLPSAIKIVTSPEGIKIWKISDDN